MHLTLKQIEELRTMAETLRAKDPFNYELTRLYNKLVDYHNEAQHLDMVGRANG